MKVIGSTIRAVVERVTEIELGMRRLFVFEQIGKNGKSCDYWVQNWECDDITITLNYDEHKRIAEILHEYYKSEATK
jgi:hypothetical protein